MKNKYVFRMLQGFGCIMAVGVMASGIWGDLWVTYTFLGLAIVSIFAIAIWGDKLEALGGKG